LKGSEFHQLVRNIQQINKDDGLTLLEEKLAQIKNQNLIKPNHPKRILLTGSDLDDTNFIEFLEDQGFYIIIDDLGVGTKYFWDTVDEIGDPIENLAKYHLSKPIHSVKFPSYERFKVLKKLAQSYNVDGVINVAQKFCEPVLYDHPFLSKKFKELGIPYLFVELTYNRESYKQLTTRFSAFAEII
ncbi:MAG: 2-hydroxyacyl-CoA dehydratase, partial [Candidatus Thorarchaeota archaeon]